MRRLCYIQPADPLGRCGMRAARRCAGQSRCDCFCICKLGAAGFGGNCTQDRESFRREAEMPARSAGESFEPDACSRRRRDYHCQACQLWGHDFSARGSTHQSYRLNYGPLTQQRIQRATFAVSEFRASLHHWLAPRSQGADARDQTVADNLAQWWR